MSNVQTLNADTIKKKKKYESSIKANRKYRESHREQLSTYARDFYHANNEKIRARRRELYALKKARLKAQAVKKKND